MVLRGGGLLKLALVAAAVVVVVVDDTTAGDERGGGDLRRVPPEGCWSAGLAGTATDAVIDDEAALVADGESGGPVVQQAPMAAHSFMYSAYASAVLRHPTML